MEEESKVVLSRKRMIPEGVVHHMPCEIQYTGSAPVADYFVVKQTETMKESMFRGRLLQGETIPFPKGVEGNP